MKLFPLNRRKVSPAKAKINPMPNQSAGKENPAVEKNQPKSARMMAGFDRKLAVFQLKQTASQFNAIQNTAK